MVVARITRHPAAVPTLQLKRSRRSHVTKEQFNSPYVSLNCTAEAATMTLQYGTKLLKPKGHTMSSNGAAILPEDDSSLGQDFPNVPISVRSGHSHCNVLGVKVSAIDMPGAVSLSDDLISSGRRGYVCVTGVHGVMEAQADSDFLHILNNSFMNVPDGQPMTWVGRLQGFKAMKRVYGPDFMIELCNHSVERGYRHFLYGGNEGVAALLGQCLTQRIPGLQIVGTYTPPFRPLNSVEELELRTLIQETKPDIIWVGLSTPKQEKFMYRYLEQLDVPLMVGVGAAFDIHTGRTHDAPNWMKRSGLQWLHRLVQEPRRLARRYLINNPKFLFLITLQFLGLKSVTSDQPE
jgi:N-acetylglucosaminyldiphosphoundecaprenol N-acetyl-beta-D-mannosaminyltransferase